MLLFFTSKITDRVISYEFGSPCVFLCIISLLSDDIGKILGVDDCPCGRKGKYFRFEKRTEKADIKGCGDTID